MIKKNQIFEIKMPLNMNKIFVKVLNSHGKRVELQPLGIDESYVMEMPIEKLYNIKTLRGNIEYINPLKYIHIVQLTGYIGNVIEHILDDFVSSRANNDEMHTWECGNTLQRADLLRHLYHESDNLRYEIDIEIKRIKMG